MTAGAPTMLFRYEHFPSFVITKIKIMNQCTQEQSATIPDSGSGYNRPGLIMIITNLSAGQRSFYIYQPLIGTAAEEKFRIA